MTDFHFHKSLYAIIWLKNILKHENKYKMKETNNELNVREMNARVSIRPQNRKSVVFVYKTGDSSYKHLNKELRRDGQRQTYKTSPCQHS